jgi:hypothetical protein
VSPVKGSSLDSNTTGGNSLNSPRSVLGFEPLGSGRSIGEEEEENNTEDHGNSSKDVEDQLPSGNRRVGERSDTSGHQSTLLW